MKRLKPGDAPHLEHFTAKENPNMRMVRVTFHDGSECWFRAFVLPAEGRKVVEVYNVDPTVEVWA